MIVENQTAKEVPALLPEQTTKKQPVGRGAWGS
jgi:hypothetical protein